MKRSSRAGNQRKWPPEARRERGCDQLYQICPRSKPMTATFCNMALVSDLDKT